MAADTAIALDASSVSESVPAHHRGQGGQSARCHLRGDLFKPGTHQLLILVNRLKSGLSTSMAIEMFIRDPFGAWWYGPGP